MLALFLPILFGGLGEAAGPVATVMASHFEGTAIRAHLLSQDFASHTADKAFRVLSGGRWTAHDHRYSLQDPKSQRVGIGDANLVVLRRPLLGDWRVQARLAFGAGTRSGFSLVFGLTNPDHYFYAAFSRASGPGTNGIFKVDGRVSRRIASFGAKPPLVTGRPYRIALTEIGATIRIELDGTTVASRSGLVLEPATRIGFGSQGGPVTASDLEVFSLVPRAHTTPTGAGSGPARPVVHPSSVVSPGAQPVSVPSPSPKPPQPGPSAKASQTPAAAPSAAPSAQPSTPAVQDLASFFGSDFTASDAFCTFSHQMASVSDGVLAVTYPAGSTAPSMGPPYGGAQICEPFSSGPQTTATLRYQVRFPVGFQFVKGGKLPGLYGGVEPFSGGGHNPNGWSLRLMWRSGGAGEIYAYIAGVNGYGLDLGRGDFSWPADGQWHAVSLQVVLNTPGEANGEAVLSLDGKVVIDTTGLSITDAAVPISGLFFSTFFGGHDPSWSPTAPMSADFAGFGAS